MGESIAALKDKIDERYLSVVELHGNFEHTDSDSLVKKLHQQIEESGMRFVEGLAQKVDIEENKRWQSKSFLDLMSLVNEGKVDSMYVGRLGANDEDYQNPIAPLGANHIALAVLELGGEVQFYSDLDFEAVENNILFRFRY